MKLICYFDGSYRCNKNKMYWAFVINDQNGNIIQQKNSSLTQKVCTSNLAEFIALKELLLFLNEYSQSNTISNVEIYGDCKNIINGINGESKIRPKHLKEIKDICLEYIDQIKCEDIEISWISRKNNTTCDRLMR
jgi:ribonuclease HI